MDSPAMYGAVSRNDTATPRSARRSAVCDAVRAPLKRQTTIALANASAPPPSAHPVNATDPTVSPCQSPMTPSMSTTTMPTQPSRRAHRALRCHPGSGSIVEVLASVRVSIGRWYERHRREAGTRGPLPPGRYQDVALRHHDRKAFWHAPSPACTRVVNLTNE